MSMFKRPMGITILAVAVGLPAAGVLRASDGPEADKIIVLQDDDAGNQDSAFEILDEPEAEDTVVRVEHGTRRGYLGVQLIEMTPELREHFGAPRDAGVLVGEVEKDSPAAKAGIQVGDILTAVNGTRVDSAHDVSRTVRPMKPGETVKIDLSRNRANKQITATVGEPPEKEIRIGGLDREMRKKFHVYKSKDWSPMVAPLPNLGHLQEQLDDLDKRLKDLEKKLSK
jgi:membrane-associated protease RseP (regulator of RpoE activity)